MADERPCQDAHLVDLVEDADGNQFLLVAVADGAGSARLSHIGSLAACTGAVLALKRDIAALTTADSAVDAIRRSFEAACSEVEDAAERMGVSSREMAATLLLAVVGPALSVYGQVGDGAVVIDNGRDLQLVHWQEQEALNLTDFIVVDSLNASLKINHFTEPVLRFACMTDGLTPLALDYREKRPHEPMLNRLFSACADAPDPASLNEDLRRFLDSAQVNERTDDDKTLVVAVRVPDHDT